MRTMKITQFMRIFFREKYRNLLMGAIYSRRNLSDLVSGDNPAVDRLPGEMNYHYISSDFSYPPISRAIIPAQYRQQLERHFVLGKIIEWSKEDMPDASPEEVSVSGLEKKVVYIKEFPCAKDSPFSEGIYFTQTPMWLVKEYKQTKTWSEITGKFRMQVNPGDIIGRTFFEYGVRDESRQSLREMSGKPLIIYQNLSDNYADRKALSLIRGNLERCFKLEGLAIETELTDVKKLLSSLDITKDNAGKVEEIVKYLQNRLRAEKNED